eukprot:jgi/Picsp_1/6087/NSC_03441-R1_hypothetical protein CHLNCDRAFT_145144 [Chlorella variabilis]
MSVEQQYQQMDEFGEMEQGTEFVTKRLSFGEMSQQLNEMHIDSNDVIKALKNPCAANFVRALNLLKEGCEARSNTVQEAAKEQSVSVGDADLRRLKRQFSSLKNTFLHYEVKDEFIAALADGLPNGTEEIQLAQFEEEANRNIQLLRGWKGRNAEKQEEIILLIDQVDSALQSVATSAAATLDGVLELQQEIDEFEREAGLVPEEAPEGMDEEECKRIIESEAARAGELESMLVTTIDSVSQLELQVPKEQEELEMAKTLLAELKLKGKEQGDKEMAEKESRRFAASSAWALETISLLETLGGVRDAAVKNGTLSMKMESMYPYAPVVGSDALRDLSISVEHVVELEICSTSGLVTGGRVIPADVDVDELVCQANKLGRNPSVHYVIGESRAQIASLYHRKALIDAVKETYPNVTSDSEAKEVMATCMLSSSGAGSIHVKMHMDASWPEENDTVTITNIIGESRLTALAESVKAKQFDSFENACKAAVDAIESQMQ